MGFQPPLTESKSLSFETPTDHGAPLEPHVSPAAEPPASTIRGEDLLVFMPLEFPEAIDCDRSAHLLEGVMAGNADVVIVDYGMGNVGSIRNMLLRVGARSELSGDPNVILTAPRLILPGVGAFDEAMTALRRAGLVEPLRERAQPDRGPMLGLCLGMQLLLDASDEGVEPGLGVIPGRCRLLSADDGKRLLVPHMGWNNAEVVHPNPLLPSLAEDGRYYFVHSYYADPLEESTVVATTNYGRPFASVIAKGNAVGVQFHPEKSHKHGLRLFSDFVRT